MRQRLQECVSISTWSDKDMYARLALKIDRELPGIEAFVIDDTGFPKKGVHSVGVSRQYSGTLGRIDNCQVATSLHLAGEQTSACIGFRLYLPETWTSDLPRREKTGIPDAISFQEKWRIALDLLDDALHAGTRHHVVLADAGYGDISEFRTGLTKRKLDYVVGIRGETVVWSPESNPRVPPRKRSGRPATCWVDARHPPISIEKLAARLPFRTVTWREGSRGWQSSRFAAARVRTAQRHHHAEPPGEEQWLLCQWPDGEAAPAKYWLSSLPATTSNRTLVRIAKLRWRIERDYQEMKQELGLDHFEGRSWRGFHHHATLCSLAHAFLALRRALSPPEGTVDPTNGPSRSSTGTTAPNWPLPTLPARHRPKRPTDGAVQNLIE